MNERSIELFGILLIIALCYGMSSEVVTEVQYRPVSHGKVIVYREHNYKHIQACLNSSNEHRGRGAPNVLTLSSNKIG